jgi:hypothetical protein
MSAIHISLHKNFRPPNLAPVIEDGNPPNLSPDHHFGNDSEIDESDHDTDHENGPFYYSDSDMDLGDGEVIDEVRKK